MLLAAALALSLPLHFEPNRGQAPASARFVAGTSSYSLFLSDTGIGMQFPRGGALSMRIPATRPEAVDLLPGHSNYYAGADRSSWRTGVTQYARIQYRAVFPGIDLIVYGKLRQVEYDWIVAPGADPSAIHFSFAGGSRIRIDANGDLVLDTAAGEVRHRKPEIYQTVDGRTRHIDGHFVLARGEVRFRVGAYDKRLPLTIDPRLVYSVGFGGTGINVDFPQAHFQLDDTGAGIAVDASGNVYITGTTYSGDFPLVHSTSSNPTDVCTSNCSLQWTFVAKLSPDGSTLLYSTYIGSLIRGPLYQYLSPLPGGIAINPTTGATYITGETSGQNFPFTGQATTAGGMDAFVVELDANGSLVNSTLLGGGGDDAGTSIALGADGSLYLAGTTQSNNFPTTADALHTAPLTGATNLFLAKLDPSKLTPIYSTYLGPGTAPVVRPDSTGNAFVAASTTDTSWPTTSNVTQSQCAGATCADVVLLKVHSTGSQLLYATYFGGSGTETLGGLAVDQFGNAYLTGSTSSSDLPTTPGALQAKSNAPPSVPTTAAFVAKFDPTAKVVYATYLGGTRSDQGYAIAVDSGGNAYVGGQTTSVDFPIANAIQESLYNYICPGFTLSGTTPYYELYCASAGFLSVLNPSGAALQWSTYLGKGAVWAIALDAAGNVYATGDTIGPVASTLPPSKTATASVLKIAPASAGLQFPWNGIGNAASYNPGLPRAGGLATLFVQGLNVSGTVRGTGSPLPTELAGVSILVEGVAAPMLAVADIPGSGVQQINFQVPFETLDSGVVEVRYQGVSTFAIPQIVGPGIFLLSDGTPAIQHATDYSLVTPSNPATAGETIIVYLTGLGGVTPAVADGVPATGPANARFSFCSDNYVSAGTVQYAGLTPGAVGLYQMNIQLPNNLPSGNLSWYVYAPQCFGIPAAPDNVAKSNTVTIPIR
jgi:uncharacterized protein (TIGR03437 family)